MTAPQKSFHRHSSKAHPDFCKANLSAANCGPEAEAHFMAVLRRMAEISRLKAMLPTFEPPETIAGKRLSENDHRIFRLAVDAANGIETAEFRDACTKAAERTSARFFVVTAAGMKAAKASRADTITPRTAHAIAALAAKLELEQRLGRLPLTMEVSRRAYVIARAWFGRRDFRIYAPEEKSNWSKVRKTAGLDYLPSSVRGNGK